MGGRIGVGLRANWARAQRVRPLEQLCGGELEQLLPWFRQMKWVEDMKRAVNRMRRAGTLSGLMENLTAGWNLDRAQPWTPEHKSSVVAAMGHGIRVCDVVPLYKDFSGGGCEVVDGAAGQ